MIIAISSTLICLMPIGLVFGPLIPELIIMITTILIIYGKFKNSINFKINYNFIKINLIIWFILVVSSLLSNEIFFSLKNSFFYFRFFILSIIISIILENTQDFIKKFYNYLLITFLIISFFAFIQLLFINNTEIENFFYKLTNLKFNQDLKLKRISGLFGEELIMGSFIARFTPLFLGLFFYLKNILKKKQQYIFYFTSFLNLIMLMLAGERTSIALMIIFLLLILLTCYKVINIKKSFLFFFIAILFFIAFLQLNPNIKFRLITHTYYEQIYKNNKFHIFSEQHEYQYKAAWKMYLNNPVIGIGPKNYRKECLNPKYYDNSIPLFKDYSPASCTTHPHNILLQIMSETGTIGLTAYIFLYILLLYILINNFRNFENKCFYIKNFIILNTLISLFPFVPSGNIFNNWLMITLFTPLGFLIYKKKQ